MKKTFKISILLLITVLVLTISIIVINKVITKKNLENFEYYQENGITYINYGKFPQTHVNDSDLIDKLNQLSTTNSNGYYEYDGCEYSNVEGKPNGINYKYSDNTKVANKTTWFKVEPIKWRVLSNKNHKLTIISEYLLQAMAFDENSNDYYNSSIREWLNNDFYNIAFTEEEKEKIIENEEVNDDNVWLLSKEEVRKIRYFINDEARKAKPTDFCLATGAYFVSDNLSGDWWLRTTNSNYSNTEYSVCTAGTVSYYYMDFTYLCVRPALIIKIK